MKYPSNPLRGAAAAIAIATTIGLGSSATSASQQITAAA